MLKLLKKSIWIPYEDSTVYPTVAKAQQAIIKYWEVEETMALNVERSNSTNHNLTN